MQMQTTATAPKAFPPGRALKDSYRNELQRRFPAVDCGATVQSAYWALAVHFDAPADVSILPSHAQFTVIRRLLFKRKAGEAVGHEDPARRFISLAVRELRTMQVSRLKAIEQNKAAAERREAKKAAREDGATVLASLSLPVSRVAGQAEHLVVLASLPDAAFRRTPEWRRTRYQAIAMAGSACAHCGRGPKDGAVLEARHIVSRIAAPARAFDLFNIRVSCLDCATGKRTLVASREGLPD